MTAKLKPLWRCPKCGERFVTANLWHSCGKHTLDALFARSEPNVVAVFEKLARMIEACGPVRIIPQKTRVTFQVRIRFTSCYPRKSHLLCGLVLRREITSPRFARIEKYGPHFVVHYLKVDSPTQLNTEVQDWLQESYRVGAQDYQLSNSTAGDIHV